MSIVRIQHKGQVTLPTEVRSSVGLADGDLVEIRVAGRKIIITPTMVIDHSQFPSAGDEYTPEQRGKIKAQIREAAKGPFFGPFKSGAESAAFIEKTPKSQRNGKSKKR